MKQGEKKRAKFYVNKDSALVHTAVVFMALSAVFRLAGCWGMWGDDFFAATQIALPLICNMLFILCVLLLGARAFWTTSIPVIFGVVFFIIKSFTFDSALHTVLCILLYLLVAALYTSTAFGFIRTKWLLVPLFGLPFIYHIVIEDARALRDAANTVTLSAALQEISVLCIMLALFLTALAMKKHKNIEELDLPKIKAPKVIIPGKKTEAAATVDATGENCTGAETANSPTEEKQSEPSGEVHI